MDLAFTPSGAAGSYRLSNPCVLSIAALLGSMRVFDQTSMQALHERSRLLTGFLESELATHARPDVWRVITPAERGCQLSIRFAGGEGVMMRVFARLCDAGVVVDERKPDVIRISPAPLYNTFAEVEYCARVFVQAVDAVVSQGV